MRLQCSASSWGSKPSGAHKMSVLGLDVGTSTCKGVVLSADGSILAQEQYAYADAVRLDGPKAELPPSHAQRCHQQRGYHAEEDIFDIGHASTAFPVAGSSPNMVSVSSISHQKTGLAGEVSVRKQPTVQSRYSEPVKHSIPM